MDPKRPEYLSENEIIELQARAISLFGGMPGIRDQGALDSCVAQPRTVVFGRERFVGVYQKAAAYCFFLVRGHPFFDGNKRAGFLAALHFLLKNGVSPELDQDEIFEAIDRVVAGELDVAGLAPLFRKSSN